MAAKVTAHEELQKVQQLEEEAARIARQYERKSAPVVDEDDHVRRNNAYVTMLSETLDSMTASMRMSSSEAEISSCELMSAIGELEGLAPSQGDGVMMTGDEVTRLMDLNKHTTCDETVTRINESLHSIREMMYDLDLLARGPDNDAAAEDGGAVGGGDGEELINRLPILLQHRCPSLFSPDEDGEDENGNEGRRSRTWMQLDEKMWQLSSAVAAFKEDRKSEKMTKCLKRLQDADEMLRVTRSRHPVHQDHDHHRAVLDL